MATPTGTATESAATDRATSDVEVTGTPSTASGDDRHGPFRLMLSRARRWIHRRPRLRVAYQAVVGVVGATLTLLGLILVPLPGPGWLVVFLGLAVLGTEFAWARRLAALMKRLLTRFWTWWRARRRPRQSTAR